MEQKLLNTFIPSDVKRILKIVINPKTAKLAGARTVVKHGTTDIDVFEEISTNASKFQLDLQDIARRVSSDAKIQFQELKCGIDVTVFNALQDEIEDPTVITLLDNDQFRLAYDKVMIKDYSPEALLDVKDIYTLRWTIPEILSGYKQTINSKFISLSEAATTGKTNIETLMIIDEKPTEVTNMFNYNTAFDENGFEKSILTAMKTEYSKGNYVKVLKRALSLFKFLVRFEDGKQYESLKDKIIKFFDSDTGKLIEVSNELATLIEYAELSKDITLDEYVQYYDRIVTKLIRLGNLNKYQVALNIIEREKTKSLVSLDIRVRLLLDEVKKDCNTQAKLEITSLDIEKLIN